jgi:5,6,7,8-tetrahydromethanopterin hydro-lyase
VLVAAVWVDPAATGEDEVYRNNRDATLGALRAGATGEPALADIVAAGANPWNPFFTGLRP